MESTPTEQPVVGHPEESTLCESCRDVLVRFSNTTASRFDEYFPDSRRLSYVDVVDTLDAKESRDCHLCFLFLRMLLEEQREKIRHYTANAREQLTFPGFFIRFRRHIDWDEQDIFFRLTVYLGDPATTDALTPDLALGLIWPEELQTDLYGSFETTSTFTNSVELGSHWLQDCRSWHPICQSLRASPGFRPTRLLDVGISSLATPRLCLGTSIPVDVPYLTLSHCWGNPPFKCLLTAANLEKMLLSVNYEDLPKTFQHAIQITRGLGFRYLWIDSLCIIQDDPEDWRIESATMAQIYSNGACNLSATAASEGSQGLFYDRDPRSVQPVKIWLNYRYPQIRNGILEKIRRRFGFQTQSGQSEKIRELFGFQDKMLWVRGVSGAPLNRRGWVVQERLLSRSNLHFGANQLFWECSELQACETFPKDFGSLAIASGFRTNEKIKLAEAFKGLKTGTSWDKISSQDAIDEWNEVVTIYSRGALTYRTDKLVALSGLASAFQARVGAPYIAGLWGVRIPWQLMWRAMGIDNQVSTSKPLHVEESPPRIIEEPLEASKTPRKAEFFAGDIPALKETKSERLEPTVKSNLKRAEGEEVEVVATPKPALAPVDDDWDPWRAPTRTKDIPAPEETRSEVPEAAEEKEEAAVPEPAPTLVDDNLDPFYGKKKSKKKKKRENIIEDVFKVEESISGDHKAGPADISLRIPSTSNTVKTEIETLETSQKAVIDDTSWGFVVTQKRRGKKGKTGKKGKGREAEPEPPEPPEPPGDRDRDWDWDSVVAWRRRKWKGKGKGREAIEDASEFEGPSTETYIGPSWSWVVSSQPVEYPPEITTSLELGVLPPVMEEDYEYVNLSSDDNPYGEISYAVLGAKGPLAFEELHKLKSGKYEGSHVGRFDGVYWDSDRHALASQDTTDIYLFCVLGFTEKHPSTAKASTWGLLLEITGRRHRRMFRRCGIFSIHLGERERKYFNLDIEDEQIKSEMQGGIRRHRIEII